MKLLIIALAIVAGSFAQAEVIVVPASSVVLQNASYETSAFRMNTKVVYNLFVEGADFSLCTSEGLNAANALIKNLSIAQAIKSDVSIDTEKCTVTRTTSQQCVNR